MAWLQRSASVHHLFGSRLERHATSNTVGNYSVQFSIVPTPITATTTTSTTSTRTLHPPPRAPLFSVLVVDPCQSCQPASVFYLTSPPLPPDFFIKRQPFTQIQEKQWVEKRRDRAAERNRGLEKKSKWEKLGWFMFSSCFINQAAFSV